MAPHRCGSYARCARTLTPQQTGRGVPSLWHGCLSDPSRCTLGSFGLREGRLSPRIQTTQVVVVDVVVVVVMMVGVVVR